MKGAAAMTSGFFCAAVAVARQSGQCIAACGVEDLDVGHDAEHAVASPRFWKPFITLSTMISAATPSAMPSIDTSEMKEMKPLRRPTRPARV